MKARIRTIKPEAHLDEGLWDLEQELGAPVFRAFTGLWNYADKEGRFEWRPRPLKSLILPYWDGDFSRVLDALVTRGFLVRYTVAGREYGLVRTFAQHQVINNRETESKLPPPPPTSGKHAVSQRVPDACLTRDDARPTRQRSAQGEGKGREGEQEGKGSKVLNPEREIVRPISPARVEHEPEASEHSVEETYCPANLLERARELQIFPEMAEMLRVSVVQLEAETHEFLTYWLIGKGMGKKRTHWMTKLREHLRKRATSGEMKPSKSADNFTETAEYREMQAML